MADREQRTEQATPRKQQQMRERGQVARSADVTSAAGLCAGVVGLAASSERLVRELSMYAVRSFRLTDAGRPSQAIHAASTVLLPAALPIVLGAVAAAAAGVAQARTFSLPLALPKAERIDPLAHLANLVPGKAQLLEIAKQMAKLLCVGYVAYALIAAAMPMFSVLSATEPAAAAAFVASVAQKLFVRVSLALLLLAGADYWLALRKFQTDAMMSREEVKDERKQEEVSPEIRNRIRRRMRELLKNRALSDVGKATVLVTNPTHYAIALRYLPGKDFAPMVLAKGKDELALQMRAEARKKQVPMVENRPLARQLYAEGKVGRAIPVELYRAVAEVIAYVIQLGRRHGTEPGAAPAATRGEA